MRFAYKHKLTRRTKTDRANKEAASPELRRPRTLNNPQDPPQPLTTTVPPPLCVSRCTTLGFHNERVCLIAARAAHATTARHDAPRTTHKLSPDRRLLSPLDTAATGVTRPHATMTACVRASTQPGEKHRRRGGILRLADLGNAWRVCGQCFSTCPWTQRALQVHVKPAPAPRARAKEEREDHQRLPGDPLGWVKFADTRRVHACWATSATTTPRNASFCHFPVLQPAAQVHL